MWVLLYKYMLLTLFDCGVVFDFYRVFIYFGRYVTVEFFASEKRLSNGFYGLYFTKNKEKLITLYIV